MTDDDFELVRAATIEEIVAELREHHNPSLLILSHFSPDGGWMRVSVLDNCLDRKLAKAMLQAALENYDLETRQ